MSIESIIFSKSKPSFDKLIEYGFLHTKNGYEYHKEFMKIFRIDLLVKEDGSIDSHVIDLEFNEEYNLFRVESNTGKFAGEVRIKYESILNDIREKCFDDLLFSSPQANRIVNWINAEYGVLPEFPWDDKNNSDTAIFRVKGGEKWFAIIMNIKKSKLDFGDEYIDCMNLKLDDEVAPLIGKPGFYECYHMNKKKWISVILNDTLDDEVIKKYIRKSYLNITGPTEWIVPANPKYYPVIEVFRNNKITEWKQAGSIKVGDIIYLYIASPYSSIMFKAKVIEVGIPFEYHDGKVNMKELIRVEKLDEYIEGKYNFDVLKSFGVTMIRGTRSMPKKLSDYINKNK